MDLFVNELSLDGQFGSVDRFLTALKEVIGCRQLADRYRHPLYCLHSIANKEVMHGLSLKEALRQNHDMNLTRQVMSWLSRHGPFWEDERTHAVDDYFAHNEEIVTDSSLGEATYRQAIGHTVAIVGFPESRFCRHPLPIMWYQSDERKEVYHLPNFWQQRVLEAHLITHEAPVQSWGELIARAKQRFVSLTFLPSIEDPLKGQPFNTTIAERTLFLLDILNRLKSCFDETATLTPEGHTILEQFFHGDQALFSDESDTNKRIFVRQLTFRLPTGEVLFCPFHGKIRTQFYRIHHSWPVRPDEPLYIAYIGPKITKN